MNLLLNNSDLFRFVERVTGCEAIGSFSGRIYRYLPDEDHYDQWHDDLTDSRLVALSLNLSPMSYRDGVLEIREAKSKRIVQRIANTGYGDAILFAISDALQHRRTPVGGESPKTAFAGWFKARPDFLDSIKATA
jgi:hypothetical protein